jgi:signal peptidase I
LGDGFQSYSYGNQATLSYTYRKDEKEPLLALVLSILIPGLGQIYCGKVGRGIGILLLLGMLSFVSLIPLFFIMDPVDFDFAGFFVLNVVVSVIVFIIYIWQIYDAYRCADNHNRMAPPMRY